jgi:hypothetical protein
MTGDEHMGSGDLGGQSLLLRSGDEMVDEDAQQPLGAGPELGDRGLQMIDPVQRFDDDAELAQIVPPYVLEQFGIVLALDPDPARLGQLGADRLGRGDRTARRPDRPAERLGVGRTRLTGFPSSRNPPGL